MCVAQYVDENKDRFLRDLMDLLRIKTVSADPAYASNMQVGADFLAEYGKRVLGFDCCVVPTGGHPCVIMHSPNPEMPVDKGISSVLIYGHYDVQPAEDPTLWDNPPFEPRLEPAPDGVEGDRRILRGRGASDDKGQIWAWLCALETYLKVYGPLPVKVHVIIEGEEEIGSVHLAEVLKKHAEELKCDLAIVSDTSTALKFRPTVHYALRGLVCFEVQLRTACCDLHSGVHGGVTPNAVVELSKIISKLHDEHYKVTVPGFYDGVRAIEPWEKESLASLNFDESEYAGSFNACACGEAGYTTNERRWFRPTLECNGMYGGYTGAGSKTIVPCTASAKFSARLVADQDPQHVMDCLEAWFKALESPRYSLTFVPGALSRPYILDKNGSGAAVFEAAAKAIKAGFGQEALFCRNGGAIGIVADFTDILGVDTLLMALGSPDDAIHSPNEKLEIYNFLGGIRTACSLLHELT